ncbi:MAG: arginine N-succinyltransferase [Casimicrobiaceae bacterium]
MLTIRPAEAADLPAIFEMAGRTGTGLTSLPADPDRLRDRIERSLRSFHGKVERADECYVFVLADSNNGSVAGICAIEAAVGLREAWYNYSVNTLVHASRELDVYNATPTLFLSNDHTGHTELCSLFLDAEHRRGKLGALLSKSRLMFIAEFPSTFGAKVIAELRGKLDADGKSPFWEGLGRHFFAIDFSRADHLTGIGNRQFVAELMPRHPVYTVLLPEAARAAIGQVHDATQPARALLESEGFRYEGYVDIFDAGPTVEAYRDNIRVVRESRILHWTERTDAAPPDEPWWLVSNRRLKDFRCVAIPAAKRARPLPLARDAIDALHLRPGEPVRACLLVPPHKKRP